MNHPKESHFLDQYESSPYPKIWEKPGVDDNMDMMYAMIAQAYQEGILRPMPFEVLYELTLGAAARLARHQIEGTVDLNEAILNASADACCKAVAQE